MQAINAVKGLATRLVSLHLRLKFNLIRYQTWFHLNNAAFHRLIPRKISNKRLHSGRMVGILQRIAACWACAFEREAGPGTALNGCHLQNSARAPPPLFTLKILGFYGENTPASAGSEPANPWLLLASVLNDWCNVNGLMFFYFCTD